VRGMKHYLDQLLFWNACYAFKGKRAVFYRDLGNYIQAVDGAKTITEILAIYAKRHAGKSIGILCEFWLRRFPDVGTFTGAITGTVPEQDLAVIAVSEQSGDIEVGLLNLADMLDGMKKTTAVIWEVLGMVVGAFAILHIFIAAQAFKAMPQIEKPVLRMVDVHRFSPDVQMLFYGAAWYRSFWWIELSIIGLFVGWVIWAKPRLVGRVRRVLDDHFLPFQLHRVHESAMLFATIGAITAEMNQRVMPVRDALVQVRRYARPWLAWQLDMILRNHDEHPSAGAAIFDTGIVDAETYNRILDISDYSPPSVVYLKIGKMLLDEGPKLAKHQGTYWRYGCIALILTVMLGIFALTGDMSDQFDTLIKLKFAR
jgi:hypothetical protein